VSSICILGEFHGLEPSLVSDHASCTNFLRHINSFLLVLLDAFSSRFFNTNVLFLYTLYSSFFLWCLVQSGLFLFLKLAFLCYSSTALAGGYSCVTLTLTLGAKSFGITLSLVGFFACFLLHLFTMG